MQLNSNTTNPTTLTYPSTSLRDLLLLYAAVDERPFQLTSIIIQDAIRVLNCQLDELGIRMGFDKDRTKTRDIQKMRVEDGREFSKILISPQIVWESGMEWVVIGKKLWRLISSVADMEAENTIIGLMVVLNEKECKQISLQAVPSYKPPPSCIYTTLQYSYVSVSHNYLALLNLPSNLYLSVILPLIRDELDEIAGISSNCKRGKKMWVIGSKVMSQQDYQREIQIGKFEGFSNVLQILIPDQIRRSGSEGDGMYGKKKVKLNEGEQERNFTSTLPDLVTFPRNFQNYIQLQDIRQAPTPNLSFSTNMETPLNLNPNPSPIFSLPSVRIPHPLWIEKHLSIGEMRYICKKSMKQQISLHPGRNYNNRKTMGEDIYLQVRKGMEDVQIVNSQSQNSSDSEQPSQEKPIPVEMRAALNNLASQILNNLDLDLLPEESPQIQYQQIDEKKLIEEQKTQKREGMDESSKDFGDAEAQDS